MKLNAMVLIALLPHSLSLFSMEAYNEERIVTHCALWPCSEYDFCPNAYSDSACWRQRQDLSKKMCALAIIPSLLVKAVFALNYFQKNPINNVQDGCAFVVTGNSSFSPSTLPIQLCCLCTDVTTLAGAGFIGCAFSPCIGPHARWNCCVKKNPPVLQEIQEEDEGY